MSFGWLVLVSDWYWIWGLVCLGLMFWLVCCGCSFFHCAMLFGLIGAFEGFVVFLCCVQDCGVVQVLNVELHLVDYVCSSVVC